MLVFASLFVYDLGIWIKPEDRMTRATAASNSKCRAAECLGSSSDAMHNPASAALRSGKCQNSASSQDLYKLFDLPWFGCPSAC